MLPVSETLAQQIIQARQTFGFGWLENYCVADCSGADAGTFLHNRTSNDLLSLSCGAGHLNAVLDRQGKIQGIVSVHALPDNCWRLLLNQQEAAHCIAAILKYRIVEDVTVALLPDLKCLYLTGPESIPFIRQHFTPLPWENLSGEAVVPVIPDLPYAHCQGLLMGLPVHLVSRSFSGDAGFVVLVKSVDAKGLYAAIQSSGIESSSIQQGIPLDDVAFEVMRIEAGIPLAGKDYTQDTLLPETGLQTEAVSYHKGCYLGQETIARIKTYGTLPKSLMGLQFESNTLPIDSGMELLDSDTGKVVGVITSVTFSPMLNGVIALASLGKAYRIPNQLMSFKVSAPNGQTEHLLLTATIRNLPFYDAQQAVKTASELLQEGLKHFAEGYEALALSVLEQAIERDPQAIEPREALGVILARQNRFEEAIQQMNRILELDQTHVLAHTNLSMFYMKIGDIPAAEAEKAKATMAAFNKHSKASGLVINLEAEQARKVKQAEEKVDLFLNALSQSPEDPLGNFGLATAYLDLNQPENAIVPLEKVIKAQPGHSVAYLTLGKALEACDKLEQAIAIYQAGILAASAKGDKMPLTEMQLRLGDLMPVNADA
jgi:folate-binding protein YgfZ